ncbi:AAA family ATPase [Pseudoalteromonas rubra]|uniref:AAA family ATPase n=1 Tax=Pseudoalteromonas rubra TaxID=43658 RepID=UPI002DBBC6A2|nr:AAA family ATPase [Pseudoalteromonas rubra]MEC4087185.1 AAA family ATPase [Pseudoalteromonas rubra]
MDQTQLWLNSLMDDLTPSFAECTRVLGRFLPLLYEFEKTEQDEQWHGEGNVAIHTDMVLSALYQLFDNRAAHITGQQRQILILAALLHDIAKPITTKRKEISGVERVVAPRHEEIGASYLATRLGQLPLSQNCIGQVIALVGYHQVPKLLVVKDADYAAYLHLALNADMALLYWLEVADMQGRVCPDLPQQLELLELFRMFATEYGLWAQGNVEQALLAQIQVKKNPTQQMYLNGYAISQLANGQISMIEEAIAKNYLPCQHYAHLYVMCGVSGSGKSTWIDKHLSGYEIISLDEIRTELNGKRSCQKNQGRIMQTAKSRLKAALGKKHNVVWDATNIRKDFREMICQLGLQYGALITIVAFQLSETALRTNNRNRRHVVPDEVLTSQIARLQWPARTEGHRMLVIGDQGIELSRAGCLWDLQGATTSK